MKKKPVEKPKTTRPCAAGGCREPGEYKAPKSRWETDSYQYLCLDHVREFNRAWNYFDGWSREQIERFSHNAHVHGNRPTWNISSRVTGAPLFTNEKLRESFFKMMGEEPPKRARPETKARRKEREALALLDLEPGATLAGVKTAYKKLVKKYHPDVNKSKSAEDLFKRITVAYTQLTKLYGSQNET